MPLDPAIPLSVRPPQQAGLGDMLGQALTLRNMQMQQEVVDQQLRDQTAIRSAVTEAGGDLRKALPTVAKINPAMALEWAKQFRGMDKDDIDIYNARLETDAKIADRVAGIVSGATDQQTWEKAQERLRKLKLPTEGMSPQYSQAERDRWVQEAMTAKEIVDYQRQLINDQNARDDKAPDLLQKWLTTRAQALSGVTDQASLDAARSTLTRQRAPVDLLAEIPAKFDQAALQKLVRTGVTPDQQTDNERLDRQLAAQERHWRQVEQAAGEDLGTKRATAKEIADEIREGRQPPILTGLYSMGPFVREELAKADFDLAAAETDWRATQRHMASINGPQQLRMRQAVDNAYHSLDVIEQAANAWNGSRFPALNRAALKLATAGNIGGSVQATIGGTTKQWSASEIARLLEGQIADVTSELGNVYMGGNSPTDHGLELASKNLSADWSHKDLTTMIGLARNNLKIRQNSMANVGVAGGTGQYMPPTPPPAPAAPLTRGPGVTAAQVPDNLLQAFQNQPDGTITLRNGSRYRKERGIVTPLP